MNEADTRAGLIEPQLAASGCRFSTAKPWYELGHGTSANGMIEFTPTSPGFPQMPRIAQFGHFPAPYDRYSKMRQNIPTNDWFYWGLGHFEVSQSVSLWDTLAKKPNKTGVNAGQNGTLWDSLGQKRANLG